MQYPLHRTFECSPASEFYTGYSVLLMEVAPVYFENPSRVIIVLILTYPYLHPPTLTISTVHRTLICQVLANSDHLNSLEINP